MARDVFSSFGAHLSSRVYFAFKSLDGVGDSPPIASADLQCLSVKWRINQNF